LQCYGVLYNTVGAILCGNKDSFCISELNVIHYFSVNIGLGLLVIAAMNSKALNLAVMGLVLFLVTFLMVN
jgi:hypothetical protein